MPAALLDLTLSDAAGTDALGAALARAYRGAAPGSAVVYLRGELGAGKTTCARSLLSTLGVLGLIRSPTYTLIESYPLESLTCLHVDLYRLSGPDDVRELGLADYLADRCLLLVEWPEKGGSALPPADLELIFTYRDEESPAATSRECRALGRTERGMEWLRSLVHDDSLKRYVSNLT